MSETIILNGKDLTLEQVIEVSRGGVKIELSSEAVEAVNASRKIIDDIVESKRTVYGVNTGFGSLVKVSIPQEETRQL
ncbi:aromatic amino acid lyase, partial [Salmonella enterica subsp. enterica]|nr:aromatic amino acid lyase [Salmonella enterica subsp. enterica]